MRIEIGNRVLTEVRGESERVLALAASKRVVGASDKYGCPAASDNFVIACATIENAGLVAFGAVDRDTRGNRTGRGRSRQTSTSLLLCRQSRLQPCR